jgi:hypothetical protein
MLPSPRCPRGLWSRSTATSRTGFRTIQNLDPHRRGVKLDDERIVRAAAPLDYVCAFRSSHYVITLPRVEDGEPDPDPAARAGGGPSC